MLTFVLKRLLHMIPLLIGVSLLTFLLMSLAPGDFFTSLSQNPQISRETILKLKAQFHLGEPWYVQYFYWFKNILHGDFGYSMAYKMPATSLIFARLWNTFLLSFFAMIIDGASPSRSASGRQSKRIRGRIAAVRWWRSLACRCQMFCSRCWRCGSRRSPAGSPSAARKVRFTT
jgi:hypothetical protein